jgi:hypothetical protein
MAIVVTTPDTGLVVDDRVQLDGGRAETAVSGVSGREGEIGCDAERTALSHPAQASVLIARRATVAKFIMISPVLVRSR